MAQEKQPLPHYRGMTLIRFPCDYVQQEVQSRSLINMPTKVYENLSLIVNVYQYVRKYKQPFDITIIEINCCLFS